MNESHSDLSRSQQVMLFPTFVYFDEAEDVWKTQITGFVYAPGRDTMRQRMFLKLLRQVLGTNEQQLSQSEIFQERIQGFLHVPQKVKPIVFRVGRSEVEVTGRSKRSGHIRLSVNLNSAEIPDQFTASQAAGGPVDHHIRCRVALGNGDDREFTSEAVVIPPKGISVISDIDDTIKISQVAHRRQLLHNTFLHPFATVPGMAQLYDGWRKRGVAFHYVSSSPWQLFCPLDEFMTNAGFPNGSFHLRTYRFGDPTVLRLFLSRKRNKYNIMKSIFRMFPRRRFILIGDSGEKDPEIYGKVARKFPEQIERILIRRVEGRPWTRQRVAKAFRKIPKELWQSFRVPTQIGDLKA